MREAVKPTRSFHEQFFSIAVLLLYIVNGILDTEILQKVVTVNNVFIGYRFCSGEVRVYPAAGFHESGKTASSACRAADIIQNQYVPGYL